MLRLLVALFVVFSGPAWAAKAEGVLYDCDITQKRERMFWIAEKMAIVVKDDGQVVVFDEIILTFNKSPMQAKVSRNNDKRLFIRWTLKNVVNGANQLTTAFEYSARLNKTTNEISVYASPEGYSDRFSGSGRCKPRTE